MVLIVKKDEHKKIPAILKNNRYLAVIVNELLATDPPRLTSTLHMPEEIERQ